MDVVDLKNTLSPKDQELLWTDLIKRHCFRGNDTMMVLEKFYCDNWDAYPVNTLIKRKKQEWGKDWNGHGTLAYHVIKYLIKQGYEPNTKKSKNLDEINLFKATRGFFSGFAGNICIFV